MSDASSPQRSPHGSSPTHNSQDDRPPGGTRRSGAKTARKVQWVENDREPITSIRALDEHGLDPEPFETLTDALERHRSDSPVDRGRPDGTVAPDSALSSSSEVTLAPMRDIPGEVFIGADETAGLPGTGTEQHAVHQAQKVVSAHKRGIFGGFRLPGHHNEPQNVRRRKRGRSRTRGLFSRHSDGEDWDGDTDVEKSADSGRATPAMQPGTGVLGALLALYDHSSISQSGRSTPTPSRSSSDELRPPSVLGKSSTFDSMGSTAPLISGAPSASSAFGGPPLTTTSSRSSTFNWAKPFVLGEQRMPHARNGAGVFGPLIASTGNISGVAAPASSTLAPNIKRPGYHLSRYSLESNLPTLETVQKTVPRSRSTDFGSLPNIETTATLSEDTHQARYSPSGRQKWTGVLKDLPKRGWSRPGTPSTTPNSPEDEWIHDKYISEEERKRERAERRLKRRKATIYITRHVAAIVQRQEFILKLTRAMMMFGGPSHRLQAQIMSTAKVLEIQLSCMYLPDVMLISFDDAATSTSNIKFIRQGSALDLGKLQDAYALYWKVIHDDISVKDASIELDNLMRNPPLYKMWQLVIFGGFCSSSICSVSFNGSFIDSLISFPLGCMLIVIQLFAARNELYSNVFEITVATIFSFIAAALSSTHHFCYSAVASASVVLILPGFIVLCGSLELATRNIVSGAVRVCFSFIYSLFLGFGLAIGATAFSKITHQDSLPGENDLTCSRSHNPDGPWWQQTPSLWWAFLTVPLYSLSLGLRNHAPWWRKETLLAVLVSSLGWVSNHFTGTKFPGQSDVSAAVGALAVGFTSNLYGRFFNGNAFVIMITGILFQLPSGLANGGLFTFASNETSGTNSSMTYMSGFDTAMQLVSVSIGLTVGLGISLVIVHPFPSRRRAGGVFSL
ncbi:Pheromone-regulated membrane protein [Sparassis crispa]|uniref:Pheromone-regulated membrane protein n=1 Tax=Sparassis crispa TaxID=139825 RepID=A0A401GUT1_9APHY|nr:Pheromone-regulated membrane protein [Sparassis crispa]GBE85956.1 Pheromone-regulated membrane protein [Sparassis crispa]